MIMAEHRWIGLQKQIPPTFSANTAAKEGDVESLRQMKHLLITTIAAALLFQTFFAEVADLEKIYLPPHTFSLPTGSTLKPLAAPPLSGHSKGGHSP